jgi:type I restriction enzyme, S subunit
MKGDMKAVEDWETGRLGELCSIEIGGTPSRSNPDFWDSSKETSNRWVSIRDLNRSVIFDTNEYISDSGVKHSNVKLQNPGTVLLSFKLSIGRVAFAGVPLYTNEAIAGLNSEKIDLAYLFHGLHQWDLLQNVDQAIKGATLNKAKLKKIEFEYPTSKPEQGKIAEILSTVDRAIEQTEALLAKQQRIKTGLMQDLLTRGIDEHGNLRSEQTHKFKDSPLGRIPVEWGMKKVGDVFEIQLGKMLSQKATEGHSPFYYLGNKNVQWGRVETPDLQMMDFDERERHKYELRLGDILVCEGGEVGRTAIWRGEVENCYYQKAIHRLRPINQQYLSCLFPRFMRWATRRGFLSDFTSQTSIAHLTQEKLATVPIMVPSITEQENLTALFGKFDHDLDNHSTKLTKFRFLKTALMQDLLTGKKRVTAMLNEKETASV